MNRNYSSNDVKVFASVVVENGIKNGKLIIQSRTGQKEIPALLFSPDQTKTLLRIVDKLEGAI